MLVIKTLHNSIDGETMMRKKETVLSLLLCLSVGVINGWSMIKKKRPTKPAHTENSIKEVLKREDSANLGVDLGTRVTHIIKPAIAQSPADQVESDFGLPNIIATGPSAIYYNIKTDETLMIGKEALAQSGKEAMGNAVSRVIRDGNIDDINGTCSFLKSLLAQSDYQIVGEPWIVFGVPAVVDSGSSLAIREAVQRLGFNINRVRVIEEPVAAAIGEGFDFKGKNLWMVIDVGGGTTDLVILGENGRVVAKSKRAFKIAGDYMDMLIARWVQKKYHVVISDEQAEILKREIGAVRFEDGKMQNVERTMRVWDKDNNVAKKIMVSRNDISQILEPAVQAIIQEANELLSSVKPDTASAVAEKGILLVGGGSLLQGLKDAIENEIGIEVRVPEKSEYSVAKGLGIIVSDIKKYEPILHMPGDRL